VRSIHAKAYIELRERRICMHSSELLKKWILPIAESILMMVIIAMLVESWIDFQGFYSNVMRDLNSPETKAYSAR
jgi:cytoskeletal protein RodZ